jgi:histidinol-phosphate/aromatic aminotransferase/cobyric acid decarboxylase-like protein
MYGEYAFVTEKVIGCSVERFELGWETEFRIDLDSLSARITDGFDLIVLVNPNSPTGQYVDGDTLKRFLRTVPQSTLVWIDEAYIDYVGPEESLERFAVHAANVIVCKSMSKVYALSGARAGYLVSNAERIAHLQSHIPPWIVGFPSQVACIRALENGAYYREKYQKTMTLKRDFADRLRSMAGVDSVLEGVANFVLVRLSSEAPAADVLQHRCREHGLYIRTLNQMTKDAPQDTIRLAVKNSETNHRMIDILSQTLRPGDGAVAGISI